MYDEGLDLIDKHEVPSSNLGWPTMNDEKSPRQRGFLFARAHSAGFPAHGSRRSPDRRWAGGRETPAATGRSTVGKGPTMNDRSAQYFAVGLAKTIRTEFDRTLKPRLDAVTDSAEELARSAEGRLRSELAAKVRAEAERFGTAALRFGRDIEARLRDR